CPKDARRFGIREVKLEVIRYGWGTEKSRYLNRALARKQYDEEVFQELGTKEKELQK
ncbi:MAG: hypothetical protein JNN15_04440, partial [Blastocatellia bacterium]|nr:hypothetical protein [Blastocatellia bacterium]